MKQKYVRPEVCVVELVVVEEMLALSSIGYTSDKANDDYEALSSKRREEWWDPWSE